MARVLVVRPMLGVSGVMLSPTRRRGVRWSGVTVGALGTGYVVPGMGVGRRTRSVVTVPVMMRVGACHSVTARRM
jgi:hypothetical protein